MHPRPATLAREYNSRIMDIQEILRCPACRGSLSRDDGGWRCRDCGTAYPDMDGLSALLPGSLAELKLEEQQHYTEKLAYYLEMHRTWEDSPFYRHYHAAFIRDLQSLPAGSLILEMGCGLGNDGMLLLETGYRVVETDISPGELAEAARAQEAAGFAQSSAHLLADSESLPFVDGAFDGVLIVASLHHLPDPLSALREAQRVLRDGGILVLGTEPNNWQHKTIYPVGKVVLEGLRRLLGKEHQAELVSAADQKTEGFSQRELAQLLKAANFSRWELKPAGYLSAALFFLGTELSGLTGRTIRLFPPERLAIPLDELLARLPFFSRYPWHWNALARK